MEARTEPRRIGREILALGILFWALLLLLSLVTYSPADPSFNQVVSAGYEVHNGAGLVGAYLGGLLADFFGLGAYAFFLGFLVIGLEALIRRFEFPWWRWLGLFFLFLCLTSLAASQWGRAHLAVGEVAGGGLLGAVLYQYGQYYLSPMGAGLLWAFMLLGAIQLLSGTTWSTMGKRVGGRLRDFKLKHQERLERSAKLHAEKRAAKQAEREQAAKIRMGDAPVDDGAQPEEQGSLLAPFKQKAKPKPKAEPKPEKSAAAEAPVPDVAPAPKKGGTAIPAVDLLAVPDPNAPRTPDEVLARRAEQLVACLADFGVEGEVQAITPGPVVTMFEIKPAPGIKVSRIANLTDDLAMALKALAVRIEAPIPGKDLVGVEIPNENRQMVMMREIIESAGFKDSQAILPLAPGKDIAGRAKVVDLARMPHLLVAGATGTGKSVCLNSLLLSFLYKFKPEDLKLLLIDPKRIEFAVYADLPHLVHPVVTEMSQAKSALDWAVHEMDQRYEAIAKLSVRNIAAYNEKLASLGPDRPDELADLEPMPYMVLIIDELADLMLTSGKEVETSIVRLAQLARAAGIHMIIATQRPSVDVVTGLIKANFPCRIGFQVSSRHDSRTILDTSGAEGLLGKGDMLFKPSGGKMMRLHGSFVGDDEVAQVVGFWKAQQPPSYRVNLEEWQSESAGPLEGEAGAMDGDPLYKEAVDFVCSQGKTSISMLQRRFRIGFNKSARLIEQMELDGVIGPADGTKPRLVIRNME